MDKDQRKLFVAVGVCLMSVQLAERALQESIDTVFDDETVRLSEQSEPERKQTLGDFVKKLKKRAKLPYHIRERFFDFIKMRNQFIHEFDFDFQTEKGREQAEAFLIKLSSLATAIALLLTAILQASAKDEYGVDFSEGEADENRRILKALENQFGPLAREILAGRNKVLARSKMGTRS
jgi:hypothetical protein